MNDTKLAVMAQAGANISVMLGNPRTSRLGALMLLDLEALHAQTFKGDEFKEGREIVSKRHDAAKAASDAYMARVGPELWKKWHSRAVILHLAEKRHQEDELRWINENITARIPCGECKQHFKAMLLESFPAGWDDYFSATVAIHNGVNRRLGKPVLLTEEARALYA